MPDEYASHEAFLATKIGDKCDRCGHQFACPDRPRGANRSGYNLDICVACSYEERVTNRLKKRNEEKARKEVAYIKGKRDDDTVLEVSNVAVVCITAVALTLIFLAFFSH